MSFVSVAQACRRLGIDAKTLHRWLAEAQFPLHSHPRDGRKKEVSSEHLHLLARRHQRSLAPLPQEPPVPEALEGPALPTALLALPEWLDALQTQIAALQQQVTDLTRLLQPLGQEPALPAAPAQQSRRCKRSPKPPRKPVHVIPRVEYDKQGHYVVICPKHGVLPLEPDTPEWFAWLAEQSSFRFVGKAGRFSAHHEWRVPRGAWRAHRHIRNHGYSLRLAPTHELTIAVLEQVATTLQAHLN
jgi:transposase-like protein